MLTIGILSALGLLLLALKAGGKKVIGMDIVFDIGITITIMSMFAGTFSGMAAAMIGGLFVTVILFIMKKTMVHETLTVQKGIPKWKEVDPRDH